MANNFDSVRGSLIFSETKIELSIHTGETYSGSFDFEEENGRLMEGCVYSSSIRMQPEETEFSGNKITVHYTLDSEGMRPGDVLKGVFSIVSDMGEYIVPFVVTVNYEVIESSLGSIKNLFHFTNLAKSEWNEAAVIFTHPGFIDIMTGNDAKYRNLYIGLVGHGNRNYAMDEFLIGINKKGRAEYSLNTTEINISNPQGEVPIDIMIERNGWGYALFAVKAEGDFISLERTRIDEDDFLGNVCRYTFTIREDRLHAGCNLGRVTFKHLYGSFFVNVSVTNVNFADKSLTRHRNKSVCFSQVRYYLDYCAGKIGKNKWVKMSEDLVSHRANIDADDYVNYLYQAYLLLEQERYNEAKWILDKKLADVIEQEANELYCFYLYLMCLYNVDDYYTLEINNQVKSIYSKDSDNWRVAWVLMHTSDEMRRNPARMYAFAIAQLARGCNSPIFYVEVLKLLNESPSLLVHFDDDERRLLRFAAKNGLMGDELMRHVAYQAGKVREYDERIIKMLIAMYDKKPMDETLQAICSQLMRGEKIGTQYFEWYKLATQNGLDLTKLYEYYMLSVDLLSEEPIPTDVLRYFSYQCNLPTNETAYLYAYVVKNKEKLDEIYESYRESIERFIVKQLYAGKIGRDLAYLYQEVLMKEMATVDNIRQFAKLLLVHCIRVKDSTIEHVIVMDERIKSEMVYPIKDGVAYVTLNSADYTILLEDRVGNRFYGTKEYSTERYFLPRKLLPKIEKYTEDTLLFDLYICDGNPDYITVTDRNVGRYRYLEQCAEVSDSYKASLRLPIVRYYQEKDDPVRLKEILNSTVDADVPFKDRDEYIRLLISIGEIDRAFQCTKYYGFESIDSNLTARLATLILDRDGMLEDRYLTYMIENAFSHGKYNELLLQYLVKFYKGSVKNLRNIWKAASGFFVDTYDICEQMILQSLNTGAYIGEEVQILKEYVAGGAKADVELEYLIYFAQEYFVRDRIVDEYMFSEMARVFDNENTLPVICMLAYVKYYADNNATSKLSEEVSSHISSFIQVLYGGKNICMPFMQQFADISPEAAQMSNMMMIEYHGESNSRAIINYCVVNEHMDTTGYTREEMLPVYGGVFVKSFLLFFGESLQYYITEEYDGMEQLTESGTLSRNDASTDQVGGRYAMINDIAIADALKDYDTALELLEEYKYKEFVTNNLFRLQ
ncbi:MAG: hypothetical protein KBT19_01565 [Lachnospiraceae bacterium]|nr:hypothetical protein [Candidatus Colinaster equi]